MGYFSCKKDELSSFWSESCIMYLSIHFSFFAKMGYKSCFNRCNSGEEMITSMAFKIMWLIREFIYLALLLFLLFFFLFYHLLLCASLFPLNEQTKTCRYPPCSWFECCSKDKVMVPVASQQRRSRVRLQVHGEESAAGLIAFTGGDH